MSGRDGPLNAEGSGPCVHLLRHSPCGREGRSTIQALPVVGQLGGRLRLSPQGLGGHEACKVKRLCPRAQVIPGPRSLMGEHGEGFTLAVFAFQFGKVLLTRLVLA